MAHLGDLAEQNTYIYIIAPHSRKCCESCIRLSHYEVEDIKLPQHTRIVINKLSYVTLHFQAPLFLINEHSDDTLYE